MACAPGVFALVRGGRGLEGLRATVVPRARARGPVRALGARAAGGPLEAAGPGSRREEPGPGLEHPQVGAGRGFSSGGRGPGEVPPGGEGRYEAPLWRTLRRVKVLSCTSLALTAGSAPVLAWMESAAEASVAGRAGLAASMAVFGALTTSMLHLFSHPYVVKLKLGGRDAKGGERASLVRLSPLGLQYTTEVDVAEVEPAGDAMHPLSSCRVGDTAFFVDRDHAEGRIADVFAPEEAAPPGPGEPGQEAPPR